MKNNKLELAIDSYKDFPIEGIVFRDVLPILKNPEIFNYLINKMSSNNVLRSSDAIIAIDARGFIFGSAISFHLSKPLIVARKPGKLPRDTYSATYQLEYGQDSLEIHTTSLTSEDRVLIVDDVLATGGTAQAACKLCEQAGAKVIGLQFLIELEFLNGKSKLKDYPYKSYIQS